MAKAGLTLQGDKVLERKFKRLRDRKRQVALLKSSLGAANTVVRKHMRIVIKSEGSIVTGSMLDALDSKVKAYATGNVWSATGVRGGRRGRYISPRRKTTSGFIQPSKYWHLVNKGTKRHHYGPPRGSGFMPVLVRGRIVYLKSPPAFHPGAKPKDILGKTADRALKPAAVAGLKRYEKRLQVEAAKA